MRRGLAIGGIVLIVIGVALFGGGYALISSGTTETANAGQVLSLTPTGIGSGSVSVSWSGAPSGATVYLMTGSPTCSNPSGIVVQGSGSSGSFSATVSPGTTYNLYACSGTSPAGASFTYASSGLTYLMVIGIVLAIVGLIVLVLGARRRIEATPTQTSGPAPPEA